MAHLFIPSYNPYSNDYRFTKEINKHKQYIKHNTQKLQKINPQSKTLSREESKRGISLVVAGNKTRNDILQYLIILTADDYKSSLFSKSTYEKLKSKQKLYNGILNIANIEDFIINDKINTIDTLDTLDNKHKQYINDYIIDGQITPHVLYICLPKEQIYVSSHFFQYRYLDSKMNELITIFSSLCCKSIKLNFIRETSSTKNFNIEGAINLTPIDIKANIKLSNDNTSNNISSTLREINFQEPTKNDSINIDTFGDYSKFFYLPKDESWINIIRRRINNKSITDTFKYNYQDYHCISKKLYAHLQSLQIMLHYETQKYDNLVIEYDIEYFPFTYDIPKVPEVQIFSKTSHFKPLDIITKPYKYISNLFSS